MNDEIYEIFKKYSHSTFLLTINKKGYNVAVNLNDFIIDEFGNILLSSKDNSNIYIKNITNYKLENIKYNRLRLSLYADDEEIVFIIK